MRSTLIKAFALLLVLIMTASLFACDNGEAGTEQPTGSEQITENTTEPTETPTEETAEGPTEAPTADAPTSAPTESETTEAPTEPETTEVPTEPETTEAPTESETTEAPTEPETTEAPTEPETTEAPTEFETTEAPTEPETTEAPTEPETTEAPTEPETTEEETTEEFETTVDPADCTNHSFRNKNGIYRCTKCGFIPECKGEHPYEADQTGHRKSACDKCGKGVGDVMDHEYVEKVVDEGDLFLFSFRCSVCRYIAYEQEVPYEINSFFSAGELAYGDASGLDGSFGFDSGVGFACYKRTEGGNLTLKVASNNEADEPSGRYLIMKVRLAASKSSFSATVKSADAAQPLTVSFTALKGGWITLVIDMTKMVDEKDGESAGYLPDAAGDHYLSDLSIDASTGAGEEFDIAYVILCDELEDAKEFTDSERVVYTYDDVMKESPSVKENECRDDEGNLVEHKIVVNGDGTHSILETCYYCGLAAVTDQKHTYVQAVVTADGVEYLACKCSVCETLMGGDGIYVNKYISAVDINTQGRDYYMLTQHGVSEADGKSFATFSGTGTTAQIIYARTGYTAAEEASAFNVGDAKYFIIKMRTNAPTISFYIHFGTATAPSNGKESGGKLKLPTTAVKSGEWATYVVDLTEVIGNWYTHDGDGTYTLTNFFYHIGSTDFTKDCVYDIEYMAFVTDWNEVDAMVESPDCINITGNGEGTHIMVDGSGCVAHQYSTEKKDGEYVGICAVCGNEKRYSVSADVEKYMPADKLVPAVYAGCSIDTTLMSEGELEFMRFDNFNGVNLQTHWSGITFINKQGGESGRYLVMKYRLGENGLGQESLKMYMSTVNTTLQNEKQGVGIKVYEDGLWHVVVIDLASRVNNGDGESEYVLGEDGKYSISFMQMRIFHARQYNEDGSSMPDADDYMDIAYLAFCDTLEDLPKIMGSDTVYELSVSETENEVGEIGNNE